MHVLIVENIEARDGLIGLAGLDRFTDKVTVEIDGDCHPRAKRLAG